MRFHVTNIKWDHSEFPLADFRDGDLPPATFQDADDEDSVFEEIFNTYECPVLSATIEQVED